ncbi:DUF2264 domain-containing protein [Vibrio natriegens]|uniref:DUF2264 domain-containing protein n=1 Tax=Vibrio natriegens TaxID=691 RepID=UPI003DA0A7F0
MAISLNCLANTAQGCTGRSETLKMLKAIVERQMDVVRGTTQDVPHFNSAAHYTESVAGIEHVCRLMWGAVPAGEALKDEQAELRQLIANGTNPMHQDFWQFPRNYDQRVVEMSSIAVALIDANEFYWQPLDREQRTNLVTWLNSVSDLELPPNNWRWFRVLILKALSLLGVEIQQQVLEQDLAFIDEMHLTNGWYQDGLTGVVDYYNPFAFQLYALVYARWDNYQSVGSQLLLDRAIEFSHRYQYWFGEDGQPLCYGRSLNYRFAGAAFWAELARTEHPDIDIATAKSYWMQTMRWWANQPIWDQQAQLLPGFAYPNLLVSEFYTSYASPMLALKAFNALYLPEQHPFWTVEEQPLSSNMPATWIGDRHLITRRQGSYLLTNSAPANELRNCNDKYSKFAYSSAHGLCVESTNWLDQGWAGDNIFAFANPQTRQWFSRTRNINSYREGDSLVSLWQPFEGCVVKTRQQFTEQGELRSHEITTDFALEFVMTGYAVDGWSAWFSHQVIQPARVESERLFSELILLQGEGKTRVYPCAPNTNLLYPQASVPAITGRIEPGTHQYIVAVNAGNVPR